MSYHHTRSKTWSDPHMQARRAAGNARQLERSARGRRRAKHPDGRAGGSARLACGRLKNGKSRLERLPQGPTAAEHLSLKTENAQLQKLVRDLAARVEAADIDAQVQTALAAAREYTDAQLLAHAPPPSSEEAVPQSTTQIQLTVRSALASAQAYTDARVLRATEGLKAELTTELDKTVDVIGQNVGAQVGALLPGMLPGFVHPLLGQLLPELLPDPLAEHFPRLLTHFIPEILPQLLPSLLPHLLPHLLPEIQDHSQTALLTAKNYTDLASIGLSDALHERAEEIASRLGVVEGSVAGLLALGLGKLGERLAAVERAMSGLREVRGELQAVEKELNGELEGVQKKPRECRGEVGALEETLREELGRLEQEPLCAQVEGEVKESLKQELEEALVQGWTEHPNMAQAYADARFAEVSESVRALLEINRACVHFLAVRDPQMLRRLLHGPQAEGAALGGGEGMGDQPV
ncbi:hypothetical protein CALVIDRAFT_531572 [Calocera viscosa TUFC12733]|uniref:Uncharacterized protein n=1 Tax=Calocera viscosa (strain TUFC12733) TaxID=1330018 RepID=A0A167G741_CALVF|nr:hypothetical protein CALVIDRAFT_531572 [Calocera viscosa TUFC12733]